MLASIFVITLVVIYFALSIYGVWRLFKETLLCNTADALLVNAIKRKKVFLKLFIYAIVILVSASMAHAWLLFVNQFSTNVVSLVAFGTSNNSDLVDNFGIAGTLLVAVAIVYLYQHIKATHHIQVLFALRRQLNLNFD